MCSIVFLAHLLHGDLKMLRQVSVEVEPLLKAMGTVPEQGLQNFIL